MPHIGLAGIIGGCIDVGRRRLTRGLRLMLWLLVGSVITRILLPVLLLLLPRVLNVSSGKLLQRRRVLVLHCLLVRRW